jgi:hypothetical protein
MPMTSPSRSIRQRLSDLLTLLSTVITCLFVLTGCLLDRVQEVKAQSCDFERHFTYDAGPVTTWTFHDPVLLKSDVERMLGFEPWETIADDQQLTQHYRFVQLAAAGQPGEVLDFELGFVADQDDWRLAAVHMPEVVGQLVDEAAARRVAGKACDAEWAWSVRGITQSLHADDLVLVPERKELVAALGAPTGSDATERTLTYDFRGLEPEGRQETRTDVLARFTIHYDPQDRPGHLESTFRGLRADADFRSMQARLSYRGGGVKK